MLWAEVSILRSDAGPSEWKLGFESCLKPKVGVYVQLLDLVGLFSFFGLFFSVQFD